MDGCIFQVVIQCRFFERDVNVNGVIKIEFLHFVFIVFDDLVRLSLCALKHR